MTTSHDTHATTPTGPDLPSAAEIFDIVTLSRQKQAVEAQIHHAAAEKEKQHQRQMFMTRKLPFDLINLISSRIRTAAEAGGVEIMLGQFPSDWCSDSGRMINEAEPGWPDTLQGVAREFFEFWQRDLKPRGYHLHARIISFPDGLPGDVGIFLSWERYAASPDGTACPPSPSPNSDAS